MLTSTARSCPGESVQLADTFRRRCENDSGQLGAAVMFGEVDAGDGDAKKGGKRKTKKALKGDDDATDDDDDAGGVGGAGLS